MTLARDPLVVVEAFAKSVPAAVAHLEAERVQVIACESVGQPIEANLDDEGRAYVAQLDAILNPLRSALALSAPLPAPEHEPFPHVGDNDSWTAPAPERPSVDQHEFDAAACHTACLAAGLSPSALAADPECIKRVVEALHLLYTETADYIRVNKLGDVHHNRSMQLSRTALRAIGKEQE